MQVREAIRQLQVVWFTDESPLGAGGMQMEVGCWMLQLGAGVGCCVLTLRCDAGQARCCQFVSWLFQVVAFGCLADVIQCIAMECSAPVPALGCLHPQWVWCELS